MTAADLKIGQEWRAIGEDATDGWSVKILGIVGDKLLFGVLRPGVEISPPIEGSVAIFLEALERGRWKPAYNGLERAVKRIKEQYV